MSSARRAIQIGSCLSYLLGERSSGVARVHSTGATGTLPKTAFAFPILNGQLDFTRPFRAASVDANNHPADTAIVLAGTDVPITSALGGAGMNLEPGTRLFWFPSAEGIETHSEVGPLGMSGGTTRTGFCSLRAVTWYVDPTTFKFSEEQLRSLLPQAPAVIVAWSGTKPFATVGNKAAEVFDTWSLYIIVNRQEAHHLRGLNGMTLVDVIRGEFLLRSSVDGIPFTSKPTRVMGASMHAIDAGFYAYRIQFETTITLQGTDDTVRGDAPGSMALPWLETEFRYPTTEDEGDPNLLIAGPLLYPQPQ